jgi:hypothetical protein
LPEAQQPEAVGMLPISAEALLTATVKKKALYRGLMAFLIKQGAKDFHDGDMLTAARMREKKIDSHHVFPKKYLVDEGVPGSELILNRTLINAPTNRRIGANRPSDYLEVINAEVEDGDLDSVLESHLIDRASVEADDYGAFIESRLELVVVALENELAPKKVVPLVDADDVSTATGVTDSAV